MSDGQPMLVFPEEDVNAIYTELVKLSVPLDNDPVSFGPKRLNAKTAEVRKMLDRVHRIYLDLSQKLGAAKRQLRRSQADLALSKNNLFANDPETRAGRNVADREAIAIMRLKPDVEELNRLEILTADLEAVLTVVKAKHADLKDTESRLRDQVRLCGEELSLGSRWGSAVPNAPDIDHKVATGADVTAIDDILAGMDRQIDLAQQEGDFPSTHMKTEGVSAAVIEGDYSAENPQTIEATLSVEHEAVMTVSTPDPEPISEPESVLDAVTPVDLETVLPAQSQQSSADAFMDNLATPALPNVKATKKDDPAIDTSAIDDLLMSFEDKTGK